MPIISALLRCPTTPNTLQSPFGNPQPPSSYSSSSHNMAPSGYGNQQQQPGGYNAPQPQGTQLVKGADAGVKLEALKKWTMSTYKYTKQMVSEKMGRRTRTVDTELEKHIQGLKEMQLRYTNLLKLSKQFQSQFQNILVTQKLMGEAFNELAVKSPDLQEEFSQNAELQKVVSKNGDALISALTFFNENLWTLSTKTIEDTIQTIRDYENCRIEYDAYRTDLEAHEAVGQSMKTEQARKEFNEHKEKFESLRNNLQIKMKFLEENKVKVMRKQLLILHNALAAYFSGNKDELEKTMKEFHIRVMNKGEEASFLETH
ncbi:arfaptin-2-like isoform X2 [Clytia hemisphaerica]|uniref:AH domain-containing protein n=1 Tax=Clytia hemisphaerica TaxID=252671 RepID=A0A7M5VA85_9CNID